jgi:uncharacterized protein
MDKVTDDKLEKYLNKTKKALAAVKATCDKGIDMLDMAKRYYSDALFFKEKGDLVTAFAAVNYAHAWIDAGVRLGFMSAPQGSSDYIMPKD